jgi:anti-anti-sigma regulatory factor
VQGLSLPLIPVLEGVLVLPLIGAFDMARADDFIEVLLQGIERDSARLVLIDLTGIPLLDTQGAAAILRGVRAAGLLGARCVLAGVRPEIAQALVAFDVALEQLATAPTLQRALEAEMELRTASR